MLPVVSVAPRSVADLATDVGDEVIERLRCAAEPLEGARVLHVNSTSYGGGVAELLHAQIGLFNDLGIHTDWQVIEGTPQFFEVTKIVHNTLQGAEIPWGPDMEEVYLERCRANAAALGRGYDFVVIHDPQPAAMLAMLEDEGRREGRWIWRCHIDLSAPSEDVWEFFSGYVGRYEAAVFTLPAYVRGGLNGPQVFTMAPSIDPASDKNIPLRQGIVDAVLQRYGVDASRPFVTQVSRFDPWKDPMGVIDAFRIARESVPGIQLVLVGSMAEDDPEGRYYYDLTQEHRAGDPDIFLLTNVDGVGNLEVNAFQRAAAVVVQKSLREGFGLVVSEALWKGRPVVGGDALGIRLQIRDGESGFVVGSVKECGERLAELLADPERANRMGAAGRETVRERFLTPRELEDYVGMFAALS